MSPIGTNVERLVYAKSDQNAYELGINTFEVHFRNIVHRFKVPVASHIRNEVSVGLRWENYPQIIPWW